MVVIVFIAVLTRLHTYIPSSPYLISTKRARLNIVRQNYKLNWSVLSHDTQVKLRYI